MSGCSPDVDDLLVKKDGRWNVVSTQQAQYENGVLTSQSSDDLDFDAFIFYEDGSAEIVLDGEIDDEAMVTWNYDEGTNALTATET